MGGDEGVAFEPAERGIDRAGGESGDFHDVEAEAEPQAECLEDEGGGMGEAWGHLGRLICQVSVVSFQ